MLQLVKKQPSLILARLEGYLVVSVVSVILIFLSVLRHYYYVVFVFLLIYHNHRSCLMLMFFEFYVQWENGKAYPWVPGQPLAAPSSSWWYRPAPWCQELLFSLSHDVLVFSPHKYVMNEIFFVLVNDSMIVHCTGVMTVCYSFPERRTFRLFTVQTVLQ